MSDQQIDLFAPASPRQLHERWIRVRSSYHVRGTIPGKATEAAAEIRRGERKAREQESVVLAFYRDEPGPHSPSQAWSYITCREAFASWPLTSVRARITTLERAGLLRRLRDRVAGIYGRPEHLWELQEDGGE